MSEKGQVTNHPSEINADVVCWVKIYGQTFASAFTVDEACGFREQWQALTDAEKEKVLHHVRDGLARSVMQVRFNTAPRGARHGKVVRPEAVTQNPGSDRAGADDAGRVAPVGG